MISIHMGRTCLLKAEPSTSGQRGEGEFRDLVHDVVIRDDLKLAALFGSRDLELLREGREFWLEVEGGAWPRRLRIAFIEDEDDLGAYLLDEHGSMFDIHDVTLSQLLSGPVAPAA